MSDEMIGKREYLFDIIAQLVPIAEDCQETLIASLLNAIGVHERKLARTRPPYQTLETFLPTLATTVSVDHTQSASEQ